MSLDLIKKVELILEKKGFDLSKISARVGLALDESGSMTDLFRSGYVSGVVDKALAVGYKFDDNGEIDVWSFSSKLARRKPAQQDDYGTYIKHNMLGGSTLYHPVLAAAAKEYFETREVVKTSFFGFKKTVERLEASEEPAFIMFVTDGIPDSDYEALREVGKILKAHPKMFVQFIGIGCGSYATLERLAAENENAAFASIEPNESEDSVLDKFLNEKARKVLEA